jgi:hypothetical protein
MCNLKIVGPAGEVSFCKCHSSSRQFPLISDTSLLSKSIRRIQSFFFLNFKIGYWFSDLFISNYRYLTIHDKINIVFYRYIYNLGQHEYSHHFFSNYYKYIYSSDIP